MTEINHVAVFDFGSQYTQLIVRRVREQTGTDFIIIFRLSMLDLVEGGSDWEEVVELGKRIELAGATLINTGIGWHEARVPTIATSVPRAAFTRVTQKMKQELSIPLITTNRINTPEVAEQVLADGHADMVSMARPFLADADFVNKAAENRSDAINTCIGCNQFNCIHSRLRNATHDRRDGCDLFRARPTWSNATRLDWVWLDWAWLNTNWL